MKRILFWDDTDFTQASGVERLTANIASSLGWTVDTSSDWSGDIDDYRFIVWPAAYNSTGAVPDWYEKDEGGGTYSGIKHDGWRGRIFLSFVGMSPFSSAGDWDYDSTHYANDYLLNDFGLEVVTDSSDADYDGSIYTGSAAELKYRAVGTNQINSPEGEDYFLPGSNLLYGLEFPEYDAETSEGVDEWDAYATWPVVVFAKKVHAMRSDGAAGSFEREAVAYQNGESGGAIVHTSLPYLWRTHLINGSVKIPAIVCGGLMDDDTVGASPTNYNNQIMVTNFLTRFVDTPGACPSEQYIPLGFSL